MTIGRYDLAEPGEGEPAAMECVCISTGTGDIPEYCLLRDAHAALISSITAQDAKAEDGDPAQPPHHMTTVVWVLLQVLGFVACAIGIARIDMATEWSAFTLFLVLNYVRDRAHEARGDVGSAYN